MTNHPHHFDITQAQQVLHTLLPEAQWRMDEAHPQFMRSGGHATTFRVLLNEGIGALMLRPSRDPSILGVLAPYLAGVGVQVPTLLCEQAMSGFHAQLWSWLPGVDLEDHMAARQPWNAI